MNTLPMLLEPLEVQEWWFRPFEPDGKPSVVLVVCPAWGCEWSCNAESMPYLWLEHLRTHRYEPFTMQKPA